MKTEGVMDFGVRGGCTVFEVGSGSYHFTAPL
jgi:hypothetical protein